MTFFRHFSSLPSICSDVSISLHSNTLLILVLLYPRVFIVIKLCVQLSKRWILTESIKLNRTLPDENGPIERFDGGICPNNSPKNIIPMKMAFNLTVAISRFAHQCTLTGLTYIIFYFRPVIIIR